MGGIDKVKALALAQGWMVLSDHVEHAGRLVLFRWLPGRPMVRQEVCIVADKAGRIDAVSVWENRRTSIDQEPGRRQRLEGLLASDRPSPTP